MQTAASAVTMISKDKFMSKSMGKEALSSLKADLQQSGIFMMLHSCVHQAWKSFQSVGLEALGLFSVFDPRTVTN